MNAKLIIGYVKFFSEKARTTIKSLTVVANSVHMLLPNFLSMIRRRLIKMHAMIYGLFRRHEGRKGVRSLWILEKKLNWSGLEGMMTYPTSARLGRGPRGALVRRRCGIVQGYGRGPRSISERLKIHSWKEKVNTRILTSHSFAR